MGSGDRYHRPVLRVRHSFRLARELVAFGLLHRALWFVPVVALLFVLVAVLVAGSTAVPYTIYTLF